MNSDPNSSQHSALSQVYRVDTTRECALSRTLLRNVDSCANRYPGINNIYNLFPHTAVAWLLQYNGSRVEQKDGFSSHK